MSDGKSYTIRFTPEDYGRRWRTPHWKAKSASMPPSRTTAALLQPLDEIFNYGLVIQSANPHTSELAVEKYWREDDEWLGYDALTLQTFDPDDGVSRAAS